MNVEIRVPGADALGRVFLTWTPVEATARVLNPVGTTSIRTTLGNAGSGGGVRFATTRTLGTPTLALTLPIDGTPVRFFVAGEFGRPSVSLGDAVIEARRTGTTTVLGRKPVTVRVRKNAQTLTPAERDRFVAAFGTFNGGGAGRFSDFRDMHVLPAVGEGHGDVGFLPWHRAYLLDLERELQAIDPTVALPYWRFDQAAPNVFTREFMGVSNAAGSVQFTAGHPFNTWRTDGTPGISRLPRFATGSSPGGLLTETQTLALGGPEGPGAFAPSSRAGHRIPDTMWPWNGATSAPRPSTAPGGTFPPSRSTTRPGLKPKVGAMIDYQAVGGGPALAFAYDDVPF